MALQAQEDFPEIDFKYSIMVGNAPTDMEFGRRLNMHTVFLTTKQDIDTLPAELVDEHFDSLYSWTKTLHTAEMMS